MKYYFIFGSTPSAQYFETSDLDAITFNDGELYVWDAGNSRPDQLLSDYNGWDNFAMISKEEYDYLYNKHFVI